ncbi:hypothetical protein [Clostridium estertheticum]|uniref:Uncharacterized protein n=1 Tax=Clostridium estertheticum TaxID=238834 RepID=A0A7Y3SZP9_9CLOT|nr:hypothetical protein [Clostridium estertheticum]NNU78354.1 hypothetical protein [Clostridium estertheticum]WBL45292.1 hypothetical protein LOR37_11310 [Clostridium estertheticum]
MKDFKTIWVVENKKYIDHLAHNRDNVEIGETVYYKECNIDGLPDYDLVFFLLNPLNIANQFFIEGVKKILEIRKSTKTIIFLVNDTNLLNSNELVNVKIELKKSLDEVIKNPTVHMCSTYYNYLYEEYKCGEKTITDLQRELNLNIPLGDGELISGKNITVEHISQIKKIGNMENIKNLITDYFSSMEKCDIDVRKKNIIVVGENQVGKSLFVEIVNGAYSEDVALFECSNLNEINEELFDKMIILIDIDIEKSRRFVEEVCSKYIDIEKIFVVNKMDNYMFIDKEKSEIIKSTNKILNQFTSGSNYFISCYYIKFFIELNNKVITTQDVINDCEIIFEDTLGFPISKEKNKNNLSDLLLENSGYDNLLKIMEG